MKLNIAYPEYRSQQIIEVDDEKKLRIFYDKRISEEVAADPLGEEFKGYVLKITGGHDKQGFGMKQGVLLNHRTRLLLDGSTGHYRPKRDGARKRKSVRGCIVGNDLSCINLVIVRRGEKDIPKLTDKGSDRPSTRGPKRANHIRAVWGLQKGEDVRKYVVRRKVEGKNGKPSRFKSPKIQRLITPVVRQRKKNLLKEKHARYEKAVAEAAEYARILGARRQLARASLLSKKREAKSERHSVKDPKAEKLTKDLPKAKAPKKLTKDLPKTDAPKKLTKDLPKADAPKKTDQGPTQNRRSEKTYQGPTQSRRSQKTDQGPSEGNSPWNKGRSFENTRNGKG
jgi:small subunit ribosomal protein S6e